MEQAATHLPADAARPALILFTDGKHDVAGVPASRVQPTIDRLFGNRSPIAILPVGMGLAADERAALEAGLDRMRIIKDMPACVSGATFDWPQTVFETADEAGTPSPSRSRRPPARSRSSSRPRPRRPRRRAPAPWPGSRSSPATARSSCPGAPPAASAPPIVDYKVRCSPRRGRPGSNRPRASRSIGRPSSRA